VGSLWATYDGRRGWIQRLATDPEHRGQGIARALMAEAEGRLDRLGATKVNLLIEPDNAGIAGFYEKFGYERDQLIFMERWLDPAMGV
jgi:ribosomal protein S18 acetylase RimI-like enzyme